LTSCSEPDALPRPTRGPDGVVYVRLGNTGAHVYLSVMGATPLCGDCPGSIVTAGPVTLVKGWVGSRFRDEHRIRHKPSCSPSTRLGRPQRDQRAHDPLSTAARNLLAPPTLRGRLGLYGADHLARLELITELSALGFTLAAIEGYLTRIPASADREAMAPAACPTGPRGVPERLEVLTLEELDRRAGRPLTADDLAALEALGVLENRTAEDKVLLHGHGVAGRRPGRVWRSASRSRHCDGRTR